MKGCFALIFWLARFLTVRAGSGPFFKIPRSSTYLLVWGFKLVGAFGVKGLGQGSKTCFRELVKYVMSCRKLDKLSFRNASTDLSLRTRYHTSLWNLCYWKTSRKLSQSWSQKTLRTKMCCLTDGSQNVRMRWTSKSRPNVSRNDAKPSDRNSEISRHGKKSCGTLSSKKRFYSECLEPPKYAPWRMLWKKNSLSLRQWREEGLIKN